VQGSAGEAEEHEAGGGETLRRADTKPGASISLRKAPTCEQRELPLERTRFDAEIACGADETPDLDGYIALGPAIAFGPAYK